MTVGRIAELLDEAEQLLADELGDDGAEALEHLRRCIKAVGNIDATGGFNDATEARMLDSLQRIRDAKRELVRLGEWR